MSLAALNTFVCEQLSADYKNDNSIAGLFVWCFFGGRVGEGGG